MSAIIINGKKLAEKIKDDLVLTIQKLPSRPSLAILLVGDRQDSQAYVKLKEKEGKKCGIDTHLYKFDTQTTTKDILATIDFLNKDDSVDGILLQLPLPKHLDTNQIVNAIDPQKDVDGFHQKNLQKIINGTSAVDYIMPPLAGVILKMLKTYGIAIRDQQIALIAHSDIFMQGISSILQHHGGIVIPLSYDRMKPEVLKNQTKQADIIITAIGRKHYLNSTYVQSGATIIDIGIIKEQDKTYGDVDFDDVKTVAGFITPVPGGVGPMTIAMAFQNVLRLHQQKKK